MCLASTNGLTPVDDVLAHVPGLRGTACYRCATPTWELAAMVVAVLGLDDVARGRTRFRTPLAGVGPAGVACVVAAAPE